MRTLKFRKLTCGALLLSVLLVGCQPAVGIVQGELPPGEPTDDGNQPSLVGAVVATGASASTAAAGAGGDDLATYSPPVSPAVPQLSSSMNLTPGN